MPACRTKWGESLFIGAIFIVYLNSMFPWFMCSLRNYFALFAFGLLLLSFKYSPEVFCCSRKYYGVVVLFSLLIVYVFARQQTPGLLFEWCFIIAIIICKTELKERVILFISKVLAGLLLISFSAWALRFAGVPFPSRMGNYMGYEQINYFFFLLAPYENSLLTLPRFHSVFQEPSHLATTSVLLLFCNGLDFKRWYNKVLLFMIAFSLSLAAYVLLFTIIFFKFAKKASHFVLFILLVLTVFFVAKRYNDGNNLINYFIFQRLELQDGRLSGDNRVTEDFEYEYNKFVTSNQIWIGGEFDPSSFSGGSGYRVFIYSYGLIGTFLMVVFFSAHASLFKGKDVFVLLLLNAMIFWKGGTQLWYNILIPMLCALPILQRTNKQQHKIMN